MKIPSVLAVLLAVASPLAVFADHHETSLFQSAFAQTYDDASGKIVSLAEAFPAEKYDWRPAEGIRSVREALLHVAAANYGLGARLGAKMPEGVNPREFEKSVKGRAATIETLKKSIEFAKAAASRVSEEEMATKIELFGGEFSKMRVVMIIAAHANEHLGQLIAYARSSDVVPPWSQ